MARVVVLGGGFGGVATALAMSDRLATEHEVLLVDRGTDFAMGLRKTWHLLGSSTLDAGTRPLAALEDRGIRVLADSEIEEMDPLRRRVAAGGQTLDADAIVVALGAAHAPQAVPGLATHALMPWDRAGAEQTRIAVERFAAGPGGRALVGIFGTPYSCPPAPYELALLLRDRLGDDARFSVDVFTPTSISLPVLGAAECSRLDARLAERGVGFHPGRVAREVTAGAVHFADGGELPFDLLLGVPPHRVPEVLVRAGMAAEGGWVNVDPHTLETRWAKVYAIGDCTAIPLSNGLPLPKAGLFAQREGETVAARIAAALAGETARDEFDGSGSCFIEMGGGEAAVIRGGFYAQPPGATLSPASPQVMAEKLAFEADRLRAWFGR